MLFDSHAHLNFQGFAADREAVILRTLAAGMRVVNVGSQLPTSRMALELAQKYPGLYASLGLHPIHVTDSEVDHEEAIVEEKAKLSAAEVIKEFKKMLPNEKIVAIGETGLDYFHLQSDLESAKKIQSEVFLQHLQLAKDFDLPVIIHVRGAKDNPSKAYQDLISLVKGFGEIRGVVHCFTADWSLAEIFLNLNLSLGFTGVITFSKTDKLQAVIKNISAEKMLIETDAPYLAPEPFRGQRNEPLHVEFVAKKVAELKELELAQVVAQTWQNANQLFKLK
ncbi:MAG: TatD family hydrolase [Candidatus Buchananbacteria bacterium]